MNRISSTLWFCLVAMLWARPALAQELTPEQFHELHRQLRPAADEPWRTIPWNISLLQTQRLAAEQNKPVFIWAMDGHPLGCT